MLVPFIQMMAAVGIIAFIGIELARLYKKHIQIKTKDEQYIDLISRISECHNRQDLSKINIAAGKFITEFDCRETEMGRTLQEELHNANNYIELLNYSEFVEGSF